MLHSRISVLQQQLVAKALNQERLIYLLLKLHHIHSCKHRATDTPPPDSHDMVASTWAETRWQQVLPKRLAEELQINESSLQSVRSESPLERLVGWLVASLLPVPKPETTTQREVVLVSCT